METNSKENLLALVILIAIGAGLFYGLNKIVEGALILSGLI
jgi:membrane-associated PAP2 superfamily phosphatase